MSILYELIDVSVLLGNTKVLKNISVVFPDRMVSCIVGKAGSGKSILLKTLALLMIPCSGKILFRGKNLLHTNVAEEKEFRNISSFVFQDAALWANQSIYTNLALPLSVHCPELSKHEMDERIKDVVQRVGYTAGLAVRPADLSIGEQKLVSLARALIYNPSLLFLDEPTASLDHNAVQCITALLQEEKQKGTTLIIATHDEDLIATIGDYLCIMTDGTVSASGDIEQVAPLLSGELVTKIHSVRVRYMTLDGHIM
jgi:ABC-type transporter Mla maintaining outer membrane lipid asymmetry ATPase subunit MlaF